MTRRRSVMDTGHATTELARRGFQPVNLQLEVLAGDSLGKPVTQPDGSLRGAGLRLLGFSYPKS